MPYENDFFTVCRGFISSNLMGTVHNICMIVPGAATVAYTYRNILKYYKLIFHSKHFPFDTALFDSAIAIFTSWVIAIFTYLFFHKL